MLCKSPEKTLTTTAALSLLEDIASHKQEHFIVLTLDSGHRLISKRVVFIGTVNSIQAHPREIYAPAIDDRASGIIVAHNHPSGDPTPSRDDISTTQQLVAAGMMLCIKLHDHIIIAGEKYFSFQAEGMLLPGIFEE
jgi:DNA repair protein RadC